MRRISMSLGLALLALGILLCMVDNLKAGAFTMTPSQTLPSLTFGVSNSDGGNTNVASSLQFRNQSASNWRQVAQSFTTTSAFDMQGVVLEVASGTYSLGSAVSMTFDIYEFDSASDTSPGSTSNSSPIASFTTTIPSGTTLSSSYSYITSSYFFLTFNFDSTVTLQSGKTYGFLMSLGSTVSNGINFLNSATSYSGGALMYISNANPTTYTTSGDAAFYIISAIPEPSTAVLLIAGVFGFAALATRKRWLQVFANK